MTLPRPEQAHDPLAQPIQGMAPLLAPALVAWQRVHGRHHLPWQDTRDPYRVWLSEIMLQQTQVSTVLAYYDRFLARYPTVEALAQAPLDDVLALWAGLGYYSRARHLHRCAQLVCEQHGGKFPPSSQALVQLPGIGPSTAAALAAFCFNERVSIFDGNVKRVLTRVLAYAEDLSVARHDQALWRGAQMLLPTDAEDMPAYTQGLMDLGATVCHRRQPECGRCPWHTWCKARSAEEAERYPIKTKRLKRSERESWCWWVQCVVDGVPKVWLVQRPDTGIWAGLWTLPMFDSEEAMIEAAQALTGHVQAEAAPLAEMGIQPSVKHALTHLDWHLHLRVLQLPRSPDAPPTPHGRWVALNELDQLGLPTPFKRWLVG